MEYAVVVEVDKKGRPVCQLRSAKYTGIESAIGTLYLLDIAAKVRDEILGDSSFVLSRDHPERLKIIPIEF